MHEIRLVTHQDALHSLAAINRLLAQLSPSSGGAITMEELVECLSNPNFYLFVAEESGRDRTQFFLGMGSIFFQRNLGRWIAEIHDVVVDSEYRGRGLGEQLVLRLIGEAKIFAGAHRKPIELYLTSRPSRVAANKLYLKLGFTLVADATGQWGTNLYKMMITP